MRRMAMFVSVGLALLAAGCGTTFNHVLPLEEGPPELPYGGVGFDVVFAGGLLKDPIPARTENEPPWQPATQFLGRSVMFVYMVGVDLPLSAVCDTLMLPRSFEVFKARRRTRQEAETAIKSLKAGMTKAELLSVMAPVSLWYGWRPDGADGSIEYYFAIIQDEQLRATLAGTPPVVTRISGLEPRERWEVLEDGQIRLGSGTSFAADKPEEVLVLKPRAAKK